MALIIAGAVLQYYTSGPSKLGIFIIVIGGVSFIVSFFGCCGAIKEHRCMLITVSSHASFIGAADQSNTNFSL